MKLCGLTGGVGMGKSTAAGFFSELGARIVDTDDLAHELVEPGQPALAEIRNEFGGGLIAADGRLRRDELARIVFSDAHARKKLEAILHPRIRDRWQKQVEIWRKENCLVAMVAIPLLFETGAENDFDKIICVACSPAGQRERLRGRGWPADQIEGRIASQLPAEQKIARSHYIIWTEGALASHRRQAGEVFKKL
jgi:dephospho-CoA kinase